MNKEYENDNNDDFEFTCGIHPFKFFFKGYPMKIHPYLHRSRKLGPFGTRIGKYPYFSTAQVKKSEEGYTLVFEVPGVKKEDIHLETTQDEIWLNAKNDELKRDYREHLYFREPVDPAKVSAKLNAGILTVIVPYAIKKSKTKVNIE